MTLKTFDFKKSLCLENSIFGWLKFVPRGIKWSSWTLAN